MKTYQELLEEGAQALSSVSAEEAEWEAWLLLRAVFNLNRAQFLLCRGDAAPEADTARYRELLAQRAAGMPTAYILGEWEFMGLPFAVTPAVLIPRQDTETLAEEALARLVPGDSVWDLCTGSGCLAVSLKVRGPENLTVFASDISEEALVIARNNAVLNGAEVAFARGDFFSAAPEGARFSMIVSNPPYIAEKEYLTLQPEITEHEPRLALVAPEEGLLFYRKLAEEGANYLLPGGRILAEIGEDQGEAVRALFAQNGWAQVEIKKDYAGNDRLVIAER